MENEERNFDLGTILSVTSGRIFTDLENIYDILSYITNTKVSIHNFNSTLRVTEFCILQRYPELRGIGKNLPIRNQIEATVFVNSQKEIFGDSLPISPMVINKNSNIVPISEVYRRTGRN